jgi:hypothetical protein
VRITKAIAQKVLSTVDVGSFSAVNLTGTQLIGTIGGVPQDMGPNNFSLVTQGYPGEVISSGLVAGNLVIASEGFPLSQPSVENVLNAPFTEGGLNGWALGISTISIIDPPQISIPEPGFLSLFIAPAALILAGILKGWRYGQ